MLYNEANKKGLVYACLFFFTVIKNPEQIDGETIETVTDFIFLGSKVTADGYYSYEIKTLAPCKKSYDKSR